MKRVIIAISLLFFAACEGKVPPKRVPIVGPQAQRDNTEIVKGIFEAKCAVCHGGAQPKLFDIMNVKELAEKQIVQGKAESKLYKALNREQRWMPLGEDPLPLEEKSAILKWLEDGWPAFEKPVTPPAEVIKYKDEVACIARDVAAAAEFEVQEYRYLVLSSYWNAGGKFELNKAEEAIVKLLNSISFSPHIEKATPIECKGVKNAILRIKLEDFNLEPQDWDNFIIEGRYPYFIDYFDDYQFSFYEKEIALKTYAKLAYVRGDWFVAAVSRPPLYYRALFKAKEPYVRTTHGLENFLNVDTFEQLFKSYEARRALFRRSGVTNYNRIVDRYELDFWIGGAKYESAYWKTYDTLGDKAQDKKNLFAFPFGPFYSWYLGFFEFLKGKTFAFDANEMIWTNPNGTLGFFLANGKEERLDEALTEVAYHPANIHPYIGSKPGTVIAGVSCFACHSGMNPFNDEGLKHITSSVDFSNAEVDYARQIFYRDAKEVSEHLKKTDALFAVSQKAMNAKQVAYVDKEEPIFATTKHYFYDVDVCQLAAEFGFTCDEMKDRLLHSPNLARLLGLSETLAGRASRINVEHLIGEIAKELNLGVAAKYGGQVVTPVTCKLKITNKTAYDQRIDKLSFVGKEYGQGWVKVNETQSYDHESPATVDACLFYRNGYCALNKNVSLKKCGSYEILRATNGYSYFYEK